MSENVYDILCEEYKFPFEPYDYQHKALNESIPFSKLLYPFKVGQGKTPMGTWRALWSTIADGVTQIVFIVPATLIFQWEEYLQQIKFADGSDINILGYWGTPKQRQAMDLKAADFIIMSHQIFTKDAKRVLSDLRGPDVYVVYDESQDGLRKISNKVYRSFKTFTLNKPFCMMSGTPVSSPGDIYGVTKLHSPEIYPNKRKFEALHVARVDFFGNVAEWKNLDKAYEALYAKAVIIPDDAVKKECPPMIITTIPYELAPKHKKLYDQLIDEQLLEKDNGEILDATETTRMFHTLQRFVTSPHLMGFEGIHKELVKMILQVYEEDDSPLIVFGNYRDTNRGLMQGLQDKGLKVVGYWGDHSPAQKKESKRAFISGEADVIVGNPKSLGVGTDGLQHVCFREVYAEYPLTAPGMEQALGRVDRTGQKKQCVARCLVARRTIQENLFNSLLKKDDILAQIQAQHTTLREMLAYGKSA